MKWYSTKTAIINFANKIQNVGAKFLWWTWHDTDAPIRERILGAPVGSSSWVLTFSGETSFECRTSIKHRT
jgi:hypothetical protein